MTSQDSPRLILGTTETHADLPDAGLGGVPFHVTLTPQYRDPEDPRNSSPIEGTPGLYRVMLTLNRPGFSLLPEGHISIGQRLQGDSHLQITKPVAERTPSDTTKIALDTFTESYGHDLRAFAYPNDAGYLGRIETELEAQNFRDAQHRAHRTLVPLLSVLGARFDVPINIYQVDCIELSTNRVNSRVNQAFADKLLPIGGLHKVTPPFDMYASFYREALTSSSLAYQFLCLFKIIEGIRRRRSQLAIAAKQRQQTFSRPSEIIPYDPVAYRAWLAPLFPGVHFQDYELDMVFIAQARGRKVTKLITDRLEPLRNAVAHSLLDDPSAITLLVDDLLHLEQVERWLPITRCIVRLMLTNEFHDEFPVNSSLPPGTASPTSLAPPHSARTPPA